MATKLPDDFPGLASLQEAGEGTPAKVRKRIADNTLTEIPGIGEATAEKITEAFTAIDTPADQADEQRDAEEQDGKPSDTLEEGEKRAAKTEPATVLNLTPTHPAEIRSKSEAENQKSSAAIAGEQPNHALDKPIGSAAGDSGVMSDAERLAHSGAMYVDHPGGAYATKTPEKFTGADQRIARVSISSVSPRTGMEVRDGEETYTIPEGFARDTNPIDWLRVRSPSGRMFID